MSLLRQRFSTSSVLEVPELRQAMFVDRLDCLKKDGGEDGEEELEKRRRRKPGGCRCARRAARRDAGLGDSLE